MLSVFCSPDRYAQGRGATAALGPEMTALVLVDTQVIAQGPARLLVAGMGDALATWFEAKTCAARSVRNMRGGASTISALALAELCYRTLLADGLAALDALSTQNRTQIRPLAVSP